MLRKALATGAALAMATLLLSACTSSPNDEPAPSPEPVQNESTLTGVVTGPGASISEVPTEDTQEGWFPAESSRVDANSFVIEAGGSGSEACKSNFTAIERTNDVVKLTHRVGNGDENVACTMDYRFTYFLIEGTEEFPEGTLVEIYDESEELVRTIEVAPWLY